MKHFYGLAGLFLLIPTAFALGQGFDDVPPSSYHYAAVTRAQEENIVGGYSDGTFRPDKTINRAEFVKILVDNIGKAKAYPTCDEQKKIFSDVDPFAWYGRAVCVAQQEGLVGGYSDGTFGPDRPINLAEAAKILTKKFGLNTQAYGTSYTVVTGKTSTYWFKPFIDALANQNAIPTDISQFTSAITRGQMVEMIDRLSHHDASRTSGVFSGLWMRTYFEHDEEPPVIFDDCKGVAYYNQKIWFPTLTAKAKDLGLSLDATHVTDACFALDTSTFIFISEQPAGIFRYNIAANTLRQATRTDSYAGPFAAKSFGRRLEELIPVTGTYQADSCTRTVTSSYDSMHNTVAVVGTKESCGDK